MLLWSALLVVFTALGIVTAFLGFLVVIPVLGYATWHGYEETIIGKDWDYRLENFSESDSVEVS